MMPQINHQEINDKIRKEMDVLYLSKGIQAYQNKDIDAILTRVKEFNTFGPENDPDKMHNFGAFEYKGDKIIWTIRTYYPENVLFHKNLVIMKASEY